MISTKSKKIIPLNDDDMFTQIFNDKNNLPIIEEFIADYFGYNLNDVRGNISIESRKLFKNTIKEKGKEVDLLLTYKDRKIDIEMSTGITAAIINRNITFLSNIYSMSTEEGKTYNEIKKAIQINLLTKYEHKELKISFSYANIEKGIILSEFPRIDMINMEIGKKMCYTGEEETDKLIKWSKVFMSETKEELNAALKVTVSKKSKELLMNAVSRLSGDEEMVKKYEEKTKWQYTQELYWKDKFGELDKKEEDLDKKEEDLDKKEEILEKREQLLDNTIQTKEYEKSIEIAKNLLKENCNIEFIVKVTGLSKEELSKIN